MPLVWKRHISSQLCSLTLHVLPDGVIIGALNSSIWLQSDAGSFVNWGLNAQVWICSLLVTPWTVAHRAPLSMEFSRQESWNGLPFPSPGDLPEPGTEPGSPAPRADSLPIEVPGKLSESSKWHSKHNQITFKKASQYTRRLTTPKYKPPGQWQAKCPRESRAQDTYPKDLEKTETEWALNHNIRFYKYDDVSRELRVLFFIFGYNDNYSVKQIISYPFLYLRLLSLIPCHLVCVPPPQKSWVLEGQQSSIFE